MAGVPAQSQSHIPAESSSNTLQDQLAALQMALDVSERRFEKLRLSAGKRDRKAGRFAHDCRRILDLVAKDQSLERVLAAIAAVGEKQFKGSECRITTGDFGEELPSPTRQCRDTRSYSIRSGAGRSLGRMTIQGGTVEEDARRDPIAQTLTRLAAVAIEQDQLRDRLRFEADCDRLTSLANRSSFERKLRATLQHLDGLGSVALFSIDLDRFHEINDTLGSGCGDVILREVARRLQAAVPAGYFGRTGGDEFSVLAGSVHSAGEAERVAKQLLGAFQKPFHAGDRELYLTASIGIGLCPEHATDPVALQQSADSAMCRAKAAGRNQWCVFEPARGTNALERLELQIALRRAIERNELELHYQPQVDLDGGLKGMEALLRWNHPTRGQIPPGEFIPIAEDTGLIVPIGAWVLKEACRQAAKWQGDRLHPVKVAVNVSAIQFYFSDMVKLVREALDAAQLSAEYLELEITESLAMRNSEDSLRQIRSLRELGVTVVIDDFGTGYSSLSYLHRLPVDMLKIDRSFLMHSDGRSRWAFVHAITMLAHDLGLRVLAEGIENADQLADLRNAGVDLAQGFFFGRPMPKEAATELLRDSSVALRA